MYTAANYVLILVRVEGSVTDVVNI